MADQNDIPSISELQDHFRYDPETGVIVWREPPKTHPRLCGQIAGSVTPCSRSRRGVKYRRVQFRGRKYAAHRLAYALLRGKWPGKQVDHCDGDGLANHAENLRNADASINAKNRCLRADNTSGITGVYWSEATQKWKVHIGDHGRWLYVGLFPSLEEACAARKAAEAQYGFTERHGGTS